MYKELYHIRWILFWGVLTLTLLAVRRLVLGTMFELPSFVLAVLTFWILLGAITWQIAKHYKHQSQLKELFTWYYEQSPDDTKYSLILKASPNDQHVNITVRLKVSVVLEFISVTFVGKGALPRIKAKPKNHWFDKEPIGAKWDMKGNGEWHMTFTDLQCSSVGQKIPIGLCCVATSTFEGNLKVYLSSQEATKAILLPFHVGVE